MLGMTLLACRAPESEAPASNRKVAMTVSNTDIIVEAKEPGAWSLETERRLGDHAARATAIVLVPGKPDPTSAPHAELVGARAWAALGSQCLTAEDAASAVSAARAGLKELGDDYRPRGVKDDTLMKIDAADERIANGAVADGATVLLRVLETRIQLYVQKYNAEVR
jgi:hypothetical protein